jgi:hypothetical protein
MVELGMGATVREVVLRGAVAGHRYGIPPTCRRLSRDIVHCQLCLSFSIATDYTTSPSTE